MSNKWGIKLEQVEVLKELERMIGKSISLVDKINWNNFGFKIRGG